MSTVRVKVLRPLMYLGERREKDAVLKVPAVDAWLLWSSGRAALEDEARDGAAVVEAVREQAKAAVALERKSAQRPGTDDPRWIPRF